MKISKSTTRKGNYTYTLYNNEGKVMGILVRMFGGYDSIINKEIKTLNRWSFMFKLIEWRKLTKNK